MQQQKEFKIYLSIYALAIVIISAAAVYIYRKIQTEIPDVQAIETRVIPQAIEFGKSHSTKNCVEETLNQVKPCDVNNLECMVSGKIFLKTCLQQAKPDQNLCGQIGQTMHGEHKTREWIAQQCLNHPEIQNSVCMKTLEEQVSYCHTLD